MTFLQALRKVRPLIASGEHYCICYALEAIGATKHQPRIEEMLGGHGTYLCWVANNHRAAFLRMAPDDFRLGRLQWIDHMIAQERAK